MNITDVGHLVSDADEGEDKLEKGARREGKTAWDVAQRYTDYFAQGLTRLNIIQPDELPRATDHIAEQITLIQTLEAKGYTYLISDGVYYDTSKFPAYANFARLDLDEQEAGKRVDFNPEKRNVADFALWKFSPTDHKRDMEWDSPWGVGFPGWHIECSAMSMKYLGATLDIHAGGIDHVPVHHTNEIAQSEAATGQRFAQLWMHSNHITIEGEKISKSLGNGITLEDIEAKGISLEAFRLHVLESHYRSQSKFSWDSLEAAANRLRGYREAADLLWQSRPAEGVSADDIEWALANIRLLLLSDLDTPKALTELSRIMGLIASDGLQTDAVEAYQRFLGFIDAALGLQLTAGSDITNAQKELIAARETARASKDWAASDQLRSQLVEQGIGLRDTADGAVWYHL
jgi:cysteinyl-tRNA synthetase